MDLAARIFQVQSYRKIQDSFLFLLSSCGIGYVHGKSYIPAGKREGGKEGGGEGWMDREREELMDGWTNVWINGGREGRRGRLPSQKKQESSSFCLYRGRSL